MVIKNLSLSSLNKIQTLRFHSFLRQGTPQIHNLLKEESFPHLSHKLICILSTVHLLKITNIYWDSCSASTEDDTLLYSLFLISTLILNPCKNITFHTYQYLLHQQRSCAITFSLHPRSSFT